MKRFWQTCLAVVATAAMANTANAQWNQSTEIGSYQSILSRAGYGDSGQAGGMNNFNPAQAVPAPPGVAMGAHSGAVVNGGMQGGMVNGGMVQGGMVNGGVVNGGMMGGTVANGAGCGTSDCGGGGVMNGYGGGVVMDGGMMNGGGAMAGGYGGGSGYIDYGYDGGCNSPVYTPSVSMGNRLGALAGGGGGNSNIVLGVFGLSMRRDYEDGIRLASNGAGAMLYSDDVDHGNFSGLGLSLAKRGCNGSGFEAIFWGIDEETDVTLAAPTYTSLNGLSAVAHPPSGASVADIYNQGNDVRVYRDTDIYNFELNMLRNGGQYSTRSGRSGNYELMGGFRLFKFDESLRYVSTSSFGGYPTGIEYSLEAENTLAGFQVGGRNEICLSNRLRLAQSGSAGVFNNHIETRQHIFDNTGYTALDYSDTKNDAAFLGQIDLGLIYQFSQKARARVGYRALGVAGVALAADQIPYDFTDTRALTSANSNGSLLLHGFYFGSEFCF